MIIVQNCGVVHSPTFGQCIELRIRRENLKPMSWTAIQKAYNKEYPNHWAIELHPPVDCIYDQANVYHLYVLPISLTGSPVDLS